MSRLNAGIKLLFCWGELFFVVVSFVFLVSSGLVASGRVGALAFSAALRMANLVLLLSGAVFVCTCFGFCGAVRQTRRRGWCSGRRMLTMHLILILTVLIFSISQYEWLNKRERSMNLVLSDPSSYPEYDGFERRVGKYFDNAYFESLCADDDRSTTWLLNFVDERCPERMGREFCSLPERKKAECDTSCPRVDGFDDVASFDLLAKCCPSEDACEEGITVSCPYHRCRVEILRELHPWASLSKIIAQFVCLLSALMLILSGLLICFNPRDEIEVELLKTGVMTHDDIEAIKRLKESATAVTKRDSRIDVEKLETFKRAQKHPSAKSKFGFYSRKRTTRVSPSNTGG